jgi:autotransporter-associated beta strand protein
VLLPFGISANYLAKRIWLCGMLILLANIAHAGSATWDLNPGSGDWNTATNWTASTVPNGLGDTATFTLSNMTAVSISANTIVDGITFAPGASSFTITASPFFALTISGAGITNNSGSAQNFVATRNFSFPEQIVFTNNATAGSSTIFTNNNGTGGFGGGGTIFLDNSTAGNGTFISKSGTVGGLFPGFTEFLDTSTAGSGAFINNGGTMKNYVNAGATGFRDSSSAANATFTNNGATANNAGGGRTDFSDNSTAANATITNNGGTISGADGGRTDFSDNSTAASATITNNGGTISGAGGGTTFFGGTSTADSATLIANGGTGGGQGGTIFFGGQSTGGTSRVEVFGNGSLDISFMSFPLPKNNTRGVTVGSIEGEGDIFLGGKKLTVGSNNLSTTFSGVIEDGGIGGSLIKIGSGTLNLTGANTYTGDTTINGGVLKVDGSLTSNTFVHNGGTLAGTGAVDGAVTGHGIVRPGDPIGTLTVNTYSQPMGSGRLLIDIADTSTGEFSVLNVLGSANVNGFLDPVLLNGFIPSVGDEFTFLNYESVSGAFRIQNAGIFDNGMERWVVTYQATDAVLTATRNVPDPGSTLLLLTCSLLGLMTYRQKCVARAAWRMEKCS